MAYYHVRITPSSNPSEDEARLDLSLEELLKRFVGPYRRGEPLVISGKSISSTDIERVRISKSEEEAKHLIEILKAEDRSSSVIVFGGPSLDWRAAGRAEDVTDEFITGPPGSEPDRNETTLSEPRPSEDSRDVFVVHGRNLLARDAVFDFLRAIDLHPIEWSEAVGATGKGSPYIGEILDAAFSRAHAIVVLFSPDDEARLKQQFRADKDPFYESKLTGQARPNVLFEAGMSMGKFPERTVLVEVGALRPFTDIAGLHAIRMNGSSKSRQDLALRLRTAGCPVKLDGSDWHSAGDFDSAILLAEKDSAGAEDASENPVHSSLYAHLSEDHKELLLEAAKDRDGTILKTITTEGQFVQTNERTFGEPGNHRLEIKWQGVLEDLWNQQLLDKRNFQGVEVYEMTRAGYEAVEILEKQQPDSQT